MIVFEKIVIDKISKNSKINLFESGCLELLNNYFTILRDSEDSMDEDKKIFD